MAVSRYPNALWKGDGKSGGSYTSGPWKVCLHTTETEGVPGYNSGSYAPHITYVPATRTFYQHTSLLTAARALRNESGGVQTNRDSCIQLEIVCYSAKWIADGKASRLFVGDLSATHLADIRRFLEWTFANFGIKDKWPGKQAFSSSQANAPGFRMSGYEWDRYDGVMAHQHIPENTHWDTGALNWAALMDGAIVPTKEVNEMFPIKRGDGPGGSRPDKKEDVRYFQLKLDAMGIAAGTDGVADQLFLDKVFALVGSPIGGSYIDGAEGAIFDRLFIQFFAAGGAKGDQGIQGVKGDKGDRGIRGIQGLTGLRGLDGQDGIDGKDAIAGDIEFPDHDHTGMRLI